MKAKIIDIGTYTNEFEMKKYRVTIEFEDEPDLKLGECEIKQK